MTREGVHDELYAFRRDAFDALLNDVIGVLIPRIEGRVRRARRRAPTAAPRRSPPAPSARRGTRTSAATSARRDPRAPPRATRASRRPCARTFFGCTRNCRRRPSTAAERASGGTHLRKHSRGLLVRRRLELLLDEPAAVLIGGELGDVVGQIGEFEPARLVRLELHQQRRGRFRRHQRVAVARVGSAGPRPRPSRPRAPSRRPRAPRGGPP